MVIRCVCGNEMTITPGGRNGYLLTDETWYDQENNEVRCPKCKSNALPLEVADDGSSGQAITVRVVPGRTIANKGFWN